MIRGMVFNEEQIRIIRMALLEYLKFLQNKIDENKNSENNTNNQFLNHQILIIEDLCSKF